MVTDERFDAIARTAASGLDRRGAVKALGAVALGAAGPVAARSAASADGAAAEDLGNCRDRCRDNECKDRKNEDRCGRRCTGRCRRDKR